MASDAGNIQETTPFFRTMSWFNSINLPFPLAAGTVSLVCAGVGGYGIYSTVTRHPIDGIKLVLSIVTTLAPAICTGVCCAGVKPTKSPKVKSSLSNVEAGQGKNNVDLTDLIDRIRKVVSNEKYHLLDRQKEINALPSSKALLSQQIELLISLLATVDDRAEQLNTELERIRAQLEEKVRLLQEKESVPAQSAPVVDIDTIKREAVEAALRPIINSLNLLLSDSRFLENATGLPQESSEKLEAFVSRQIANIGTLLETLLGSAQQSEQELIATKADFETQIEALETKLHVLLYGKESQSLALVGSITSPSISDSTASPAAATPSPARPSPAPVEDLEALKRDIFAGISNLKLAVNSPSSRPGSRPPSAPSSPAAASPAPRTPAAASSSGLRNEG